MGKQGDMYTNAYTIQYTFPGSKLSLQGYVDLDKVLNISLVINSSSFNEEELILFSSAEFFQAKQEELDNWIMKQGL